MRSGMKGYLDSQFHLSKIFVAHQRPRVGYISEDDNSIPHYRDADS
jgi:hypothetical protein